MNKIKMTDEVISSAKNLKLICVFATGYDNVDLISAKNHGVAVCNVPGYSTDSVVAFTVATVLSLATRINEYRKKVISGEYLQSGIAVHTAPSFNEISGKTWGIVGGGNIGRAVARVAEALGAKVIVNKRTPVADLDCVDIDTLCKQSDIITLHCPLNEASRGLINKDRLAIMKKSAILVNEARGAVVCEDAVAKAVLKGEIAAFGCDVYSAEPFGKDHPYEAIKALDNVILTPHAAWAAYEARVRCINIIAENIEAFKNEKIKNRVDI